MIRDEKGRFVKGVSSWNKGKIPYKMTKKIRDKIKRTMKEKVKRGELKIYQPIKKGQTYEEVFGKERAEKLTENLKRTGFQKGHEVPKKWREAVGDAQKGKKRTEEHKAKWIKKGKEHYCWKGDEATKTPLHKWVAKNKPKPKVCESCSKEKKLELASITNHKYTRNLKDYKWLCKSCHKKMDIKNVR